MDIFLIENFPIIGNFLFAKQGGVTFWEALPILGNGLLACVLCSIICSLIGVHVIFRRIIFVSAAISQISSLGLAFSFLLSKNNQDNTNNKSIFDTSNLIPILSAIIASSLFAIRKKEQILTKESIIGIAYVLPSALVLMILDFLSKETSAIENIIFGNTVFIEVNQLKYLIIISIIVLFVHILLFKNFLIISFDYDSAKASGMNVTLYEQLFYLSLAIIISFSISSIGILPILGFIILPSVSAMLLSKKINVIFIISIILAIISSFLGFYISFIYSLPTGPSMICVSGLVLFFSFIFNFFSKNK